MAKRLLRHQDTCLPFGLALAYGIVGYAAGLVMMAAPSAIVSLTGVLLLAHSMVICAYLIHECMHNTVFVENAHNARLAALLGWFTGSCYARYEDLRRKHFRHHVERADIVGFDYRRRIAYRPHLAKWIAALEWAYIPAVEILVHALVIILPCTDYYYRPLRRRVLFILVVRAAMFILLGLVSLKALLLYPAAYMIFLTVLRFMDANQHSYELVEVRGESPLWAPRDREYEYSHTYSNLLSQRYPLLNLLTLNFAYHNAHHDRPTVPWYRLPALHAELYGDVAEQVLTFSDLLQDYHRFRVMRAFHPDPAEPQHGLAGPDRIGIDGVSFLVPM